MSEGIEGITSRSELEAFMRERLQVPVNFVQALQRAAQDAVVPSGVVAFTAAPTAPAGWLVRDGAVYNVADYPNLAAALGSTFGGDGVTTFAVPDARGRTDVGVGTHVDVNAVGDSDAVALGSRTPNHVHHKAAFNTGVRSDTDLTHAGFDAAAGAAQTVALNLFYQQHVHQVPAFDTETSAQPYTAYTPIIKV
jgi:microcystin-dependent protein